ncbi:hypothetical protein ACNTMW_20220 [Planosporangium sp. 12N6]|uniref:hypothetical protein n=1 Tax=Planosporangium spinosum TaxID=3402278 RepID=UPI003CF1F849
MAEFLVVPPEPAEWSLGVEAFAEAVVARWPDAGVRGWGEGAHLAASAWIRGSEPWDDILVELHPNGRTIGIDVRSYERAAEIACWWRRLVPPDIAVLWLFDRSFPGYSELWPDTTPSEIFAGSGAQEH